MDLSALLCVKVLVDVGSINAKALLDSGSVFSQYATMILNSTDGGASLFEYSHALLSLFRHCVDLDFSKVN